MAQKLVQEVVTPDLEGLECVYERPDTLLDARFHYCPGCGHSVVHRLLMEVIQELGITDRTVGIAPVGCSVFAYHYMGIDMQEAAHGRASAVTTAVKRILLRYVFSYQETASRPSERRKPFMRGSARISSEFINNKSRDDGGDGAHHAAQDEASRHLQEEP
jgi:pyruvate/2-oxoacid:ferredoxin oxidoreductase beta subunit